MKDFVNQCIAAIQAEIDAATSGQGSERKIPIFEGHFQRTADQRHIYLFKVSKELPKSYDDAPVKIIVGGSQIDGSIVAMGESEVTLALDDFLGQFIAQAELRIDLTFILKQLKKLMEARINEIAIHPISLKAMGSESAHIAKKMPVVLDEKLSPAQQEALQKCLGSDFLMIWGPPGTGKTHVLARLLREEALAGRTTLLMSNTNIAVDQALEKFLDLCNDNDKLQNLFEQGKFVRIGTPQLEIDRLLLDNIVKHANRHIRLVLEEKLDRQKQLTVQLEASMREESRLLRLLELHNIRSALADTYRIAKSSLSSATTKTISISAELKQASAELSTLQSKRGIGGLLARFAEPGLRKKVMQLTKLSAETSVQIQRLLEKNTNAKNALQVAESEYKKLSTGAGRPEDWNSQLGDAGLMAKDKRSALQVLKSEISELEAKLADVRNKIVQDAILVACTCAKSTLDMAVNARKFDTVIIDESSMVSLPQALWASLLAKNKFLCFGDFRQLPPITSIKEKNDPGNFEIMHSSVFERNKIGSNDSWQDDPRLPILVEQRRMPIQICNLVNDHVYGGRLKTHHSVPFEANPLSIISSSKFNAWSDKTEGFSWFNWHHAFVIVELVRQLKDELEQKDKPAMVLTPFRAQVEVINALLKEAELSDFASASTVWRSQGRESKIVIFDTVCAPPFSRPGRWFLDESASTDGARLINVALTRTKKKLYVIGHIDYLLRNCPPKSLSARVLRQAVGTGVVVDSTELTTRSLSSHPDRTGGYEMETFRRGVYSIYDETGFLTAFAGDLESMPSGSILTIFSPFLNEKSVAHWGPRLRAAIQRNCRVEIFTRQPGKQTTFLTAPEVENLISEMQSLGASVGFDRYIPGGRPMHHKIAILQFPKESDEEPIVWKGSMNPLGHYSSAEIMDRTQSKELFAVLANLLKLGQMQSALVGKSLLTELEVFLQANLKAACPIHNIPMRLKFGRSAKFRTFFMSCPRWKSEGCDKTINIDLKTLNSALMAVDARCLNDDCNEPVEARHGRTGVYFRGTCGHFLNLNP